MDITHDKYTEHEDGEKTENKTEDETNENEPVPEFDKYIRVIIMTRGHKSIYHDKLTISGSEGMIIDYGYEIKEYEPNESIDIDTDKFKDNNTCIIVKSRNQGRIRLENVSQSESISYRGIFEYYNTPQGIVAVNELSVEEYLYGVLPSEMPSSYPIEALKAQAVSARSYTYFHKKSYAYPEWRAHIDDSTAFQVYMNSGEAQTACEAVDATANQVLTYNDELAESFYYSTSGGYNGGAGVWNDTVSDEEGYIIETGKDIFADNSDEGEKAYKEYIDSGNTDDIEYGEAWYRWQYDKIFETNNTKRFFEKIYELSLTQPHKVRIRSKYLPSDEIIQETAINDVRILSRRKSGLVTGIMIETQNFRVSVMTQHTIRLVFGGEGDTVIKNDGTGHSMGDILPSAYFYIEKIYNMAENGNNISHIIIHGAGLGHGCGMSQNGAKRLAGRGLTAAQILAYYYNGNIKDVDNVMEGAAK